MAAALLFLASVSDRGGALRACGRLATAADAAAQAWWKPTQLEMLNETKRLVTNTESELGAACTWDCFNRATMLAPLAADILQSGVKGDFLEAGVASGGISIFMAAMLHAAGVLGDRETGERVRKMWVADSFAGLPPPQEYIDSFAAGGALSKSVLHRMHQGDRKARIWHGGEFAAGTERVGENFRQKLPRERLSYPWLKKLKLSPQTRLPVGVHFLKGFFNESLPGPVTSLAMLRADGDLYTSIYETLAALYPRLSVGGYVIFDDWPIAQARQAVFHYRQQHGITTPIVCAGPALEPPFHVAHLLSYWKKDATTG